MFQIQFEKTKAIKDKYTHLFDLMNVSICWYAL